MCSALLCFVDHPARVVGVLTVEEGGGRSPSSSRCLLARVRSWLARRSSTAGCWIAHADRDLLPAPTSVLYPSSEIRSWICRARGSKAVAWKVGLLRNDSDPVASEGELPDVDVVHGEEARDE